MANETVIINGVTISDTESIDRYVEIENDTALLAGKGDESGNYLEGSSGMVKYTDLKRKMLEGIPNKDYVDQELLKKVDKADQTQKDAEQDAQINLKANKADSRLLNLRADNLSFTLDENRLPSPLNQSIKVHVDRNNIDGDVVITGKDVAPNTMDFEVTPEDMAKDGVVLKNVLPVSQKWSSGGKITVEYVEELKKCTITTTEVNPNVSFYTNDIVAKNEPYFYRMRIKNTSSKTHKFKILGNTILFPLTEKNIESGATETLSCIAVWTSGDYPQFTLRVLDSEQGATFEFTSEIINMAELSARYPHLSDEELKTILDSSLPYISAQGEVELGNVIQIENRIADGTSTSDWRIDPSFGSFTVSDGVFSIQTTGYPPANGASCFVRNIDPTSSRCFIRVNDIHSTNGYTIYTNNASTMFVNKPYGISPIKKGYIAIGKTAEASSTEITLDIKKGLTIILLEGGDNLLDLWLSLNGYTTDEQKAEWCNEHIPPFEGTYPLWVGAIKDEHTVTASCGEYTSSLTFKTVFQKESIATQPQVSEALRDKADVITNFHRAETPFVRTDTDEEPLLGMTIYGKTEQFSTTGKNLLDKDSIDTDESYVNATGSIIGASRFCVSKVLKEGQHTYTMHNPQQVYEPAICWFDSSNNFIGGVAYNGKTDVTFTTTANTAYILVSLFKPNDATVQLELGSTATSYEPYTGGEPSPSPRYPQDIHSAGEGGQIVTTKTGKNLLPFPYVDSNKTQQGVTYTVNKDGTVGVEGTSTDYNSFSFYEGNNIFTGIITFNAVENITNMKNVVGLYDGAHELIQYIEQNTAITVNLNNYLSCKHISIKAKRSQNNVLISGVLKPQLEVGDTATSYEPYKTPQTLTSATPNGMNGMNGVYDERDYATGKDIKRISSQITLTGNENWKLSNNRKQYFIANFDLAVGGGSEIVSNYFRRTVWDSSDAGICLSDGQSPVIGITATLFSSVDELKNWLKAKVSEGKPCVYNAKLRNPIITDIPQEEMAQFSSLTTYNPNTTISNDDGTEVFIRYRAETSRIVEQMAREIARQEIAPINEILNGFMGKADMSDETTSYTVLPNGVLMQWGRIPFNNVTTGEKTIMFKRSFKNDKLSLNAVSAGTLGGVTIRNWAKDKIELMISKQAHIFWFAIGQDAEV